MTIKLRDYLRLHPNQGVELLTEFGYYTLTKQEIKTQLRKHGAVRSVTGRPLSFVTNYAPFGYRLEGGVLFPEPEEARVVKAIFTLFLSGRGALSIADVPLHHDQSCLGR